MRLNNCSTEALKDLIEKYPYDKDILSELDSRIRNTKKVSLFPLYICLALTISFFILAINNRIQMNLNFLKISMIGLLASATWFVNLFLNYKNKYRD